MAMFTQADTAFLRPFAKPGNNDVIRVVRGQGSLLWDDQDNQYIDAMGALWFCQVGHGRNEIADAVVEPDAQARGLSLLRPDDQRRARGVG